MLALNNNIVIDRYYRGAAVFVNGKFFILSEEYVRLVEKIISGILPPFDQESNKKLERLKKIGLLMERESLS